jgi:hypothetical protein
MCKEDIIRGLQGIIGQTLNMGLILLAQDETPMELTVIDVAPITSVAGLSTPIDVISPNANYVINWVILPSSVPNQIPQNFLPTVPHHPWAKTKIGSLIQ